MSHSSSGLENVLIGTATAPIRTIASQVTTNGIPVGRSTATRAPLPTPSPSEAAGDHP